jgi:hypothetical protein
MIKAQMLEAIFVAGSIFVGMAAPAILSNKTVSTAEAKAHLAYELVSAHGGAPCQRAAGQTR